MELAGVSLCVVSLVSVSEDVSLCRGLCDRTDAVNVSDWRHDKRNRLERGRRRNCQYVYYWHCREHIAAIKQQAWNDPAQQHTAIREEGGVQPYVIWVGVVFYLLFSLTMFKMLQEGALDPEKGPAKPTKTAGSLAGVSVAAAR